ncbi:FHA domain-containing protein [Lachnoanaerobaculum gingivalis]|uniref:FHA domain-containing protein n=1 Tax=Lachnoanaerobaculum gingivalis TaxID=2490855 RepID=A0A3P3QU27_9FIRM|nr:DUF6382 domain-containing protein [Lachnoanaerobaculum gingivalis]RRJ24744.1 FHA domain-containing protein [Lachnoanaerobaculum gingivalis]
MFKCNETEKYIELIYNVDENEKIDNVSIGMMRNNDIKYLLPIDIIMHDSMTEFKYKTEKLKNLDEYLSEELTKEDLLDVFENICKAVKDIEEYLLGEAQLILENRYIFIDNGNIKMILLPLYDRRNNLSILEFFKNLLIYMMVKNNKAANFAADISRQLSDEESFSCNKFLQLISQIKQKKHIENFDITMPENRSDFKERRINNIEESFGTLKPDYSGYSNRAQAPVNTQSPVNTFKSVNNNPVSNLDSDVKLENSFLIPGKDEPVNVGTVSHKEAKVKKKFSFFGKKKEKEVSVVDNKTEASKLYSNNFAETTVLQNSDRFAETTLLGLSVNVLNAFLVWKRTGEKIFIDKSSFRIGREKSYVDFCINDNSSVGRNHAEIVRKDGSFFIRDLKSLNFTMVNGEKVSSSVEVELWDNDIISLSNEEFEFHMV